MRTMFPPGSMSLAIVNNLLPTCSPAAAPLGVGATAHASAGFVNSDKLIAAGGAMAG